jgi:hypothetical protein
MIKCVKLVDGFICLEKDVCPDAPECIHAVEHERDVTCDIDCETLKENAAGGENETQRMPVDRSL